MPASGSYAAGSSFPVRIVVTSSDQPLNAVSGVVNFDPSVLQVVSLSKSGSIVSLWAQEPSFSNTSGAVHFEGVVLGGYQGSAGRVLAIEFKPIAAGAPSVTLADAKVLANDGNATPIPTTVSGAQYAVTEAVPESAPALNPKTPISESTTSPEVMYTLELPTTTQSTAPAAEEEFLRIGSVLLNGYEALLLLIIFFILAFVTGWDVRALVGRFAEKRGRR